MRYTALITSYTRCAVTAFSKLAPKDREATPPIEHPAPAIDAIPPDAQTLKARRDAAMTATFGLLKGKGVLPQDGLEFEREMRSEW
jgi:hypothetical protein